jgi:hypothetical protein
MRLLAGKINDDEPEKRSSSGSGKERERDSHDPPPSGSGHSLATASSERSKGKEHGRKPKKERHDLGAASDHAPQRPRRTNSINGDDGLDNASEHRKHQRVLPTRSRSAKSYCRSPRRTVARMRSHGGTREFRGTPSRSQHNRCSPPISISLEVEPTKVGELMYTDAVEEALNNKGDRSDSEGPPSRSSSGRDLLTNSSDDDEPENRPSVSPGRERRPRTHASKASDREGAQRSHSTRRQVLRSPGQAASTCPRRVAETKELGPSNHGAARGSRAASRARGVARTRSARRDQRDILRSQYAAVIDRYKTRDAEGEDGELSGDTETPEPQESTKEGPEEVLPESIASGRPSLFGLAAKVATAAKVASVASAAKVATAAKVASKAADLAVKSTTQVANMSAGLAVKSTTQVANMLAASNVYAGPEEHKTNMPPAS